MIRNVAVIDIGKTNAKVALVDGTTMAEIDLRRRPNAVVAGPPYPHFDIEALWAFVLDALAALHAAHGIDAISVTAHGASIVLLDAEGGLATPVLDYEHDGPDGCAAEYDALRPPFAETGSPRLPHGLNVGAQLHWLLGSERDLDRRVRRIVTYPQYWSGRLTGVWRCEYTSLGCHTDLWSPSDRAFSGLAERLGIAGRFAPLGRADEVLGPVLPEIATRTGLSPDIPVYSGIHDSNASLLPHLLTREAPFAVVSTGTWVIAMAVGGRHVALDPGRDTLVNVNANGDPTPSARFMGGREFERMREAGVTPTRSDVDAVLAATALLLPAIEGGTGPFPDRAGGWSAPGLTPGQRMAALSFYLGCMTGECLRLIGSAGTVLVEGPFARNTLFLDMLAAATGREVRISNASTGTSAGAALLSIESVPRIETIRHPVSAAAERLAAYARAWRSAL